MAKSSTIKIQKKTVFIFRNLKGNMASKKVNPASDATTILPTTATVTDTGSQLTKD